MSMIPLLGASVLMRNRRDADDAKVRAAKGVKGFVGATKSRRNFVSKPQGESGPVIKVKVNDSL